MALSRMQIVFNVLKATDVIVAFLYYINNYIVNNNDTICGLQLPRGHTGQLDFCNWLADDSLTG